MLPGLATRLPRVRDELRAALAQALKEQDSAAVSALRSALAAIGNAEAVDASQILAPPTGTLEVGEADLTGSAVGLGGPEEAGSVVGLGVAEVERRALSDEEVEEIVRTEGAERLAAASSYEEMGQSERAARLREEAAVLGRYLSS